MEIKRKKELISVGINYIVLIGAILLTLFNFDIQPIKENVRMLFFFISISTLALFAYRKFQNNLILLLYEPASFAAFLIFGSTFALITFIMPFVLFFILSRKSIFDNLSRIAVLPIKLYLGGYFYSACFGGHIEVDWYSPWFLLIAGVTALFMTIIEDIGYLLLDITKKSALKEFKTICKAKLLRFPFMTSWAILLAYLFHEESYYIAILMIAPAIQMYLYLTQQLELQSTLKNAFFSLTRMINMRDQYTYQHSLSVAVYAKEISLELGYSEQFAEDIFQIGLLHDIGKVGISDTILLKAGKLTQEEYQKMKEHPSLGVKLVKLLKFLNASTEGIKHHHEFYDGSGYPNGLVGDDIPIAARILSVCDTWNAMRSQRPYRKPLSYEKATEQIRLGSGTQFDPEIVRSALKIFKQEEPGISLSETKNSLFD